MLLKIIVVLSLFKVTSSLQYNVDLSKGPVCFQDIVDIVILVDSSITIGTERNFNLGIRYIKKFLDDFYFNETASFTRVAAVMYGDRVYQESAFNFGTYERKADIMNAISRFKWKRAATSNTASGINYMLDQFFLQAEDYYKTTDASRVCIVLTNGQSQNPTATAQAAARARESGVTLIAVGAEQHCISHCNGPYYRGPGPIQNGEVNSDELYEITGTFDNFVTTTESLKSRSIQGKVLNQYCLLDKFGRKVQIKPVEWWIND